MTKTCNEQRISGHGEGFVGGGHRGRFGQGPVHGPRARRAYCMPDGLVRISNGYEVDFPKVRYYDKKC